MKNLSKFYYKHTMKYCTIITNYKRLFINMENIHDALEIENHVKYRTLSYFWYIWFEKLWGYMHLNGDNFLLVWDD